MKETRAAAAKIKPFCEDLQLCLVLSRLSILVSGTTHTGHRVTDRHQPLQNWDLVLHRREKKNP